jgi:hypothetical protein
MIKTAIRASSRCYGAKLLFTNAHKLKVSSGKTQHRRSCLVLLALPCAAMASSAEAAPAAKAAIPSLSEGCHQVLQRRKGGALNPREELKTRDSHPRCEALVRASDQRTVALKGCWRGQAALRKVALPLFGPECISTLYIQQAIHSATLYVRLRYILGYYIYSAHPLFSPAQLPCGSGQAKTAQPLQAVG